MHIKFGSRKNYAYEFRWYSTPTPLQSPVYFYFMLKALFVLEIFKFLWWLFGYGKKRLNRETMVNFKIYDVTDWATNCYNTHITAAAYKILFQKFQSFSTMKIYFFLDLFLFLKNSYLIIKALILLTIKFRIYEF